MYKKNTNDIIKRRFSKKTRENGNGFIPIVIDSYDTDISKSLNMCFQNQKFDMNYFYKNTYGIEIPIYIDTTIEDLQHYIYNNEYIYSYIQNIKNYDFVVIYDKNNEPDLIHRHKTYFPTNAEYIILKKNDIIGNLFKQYKEEHDNILYIYLLNSNKKCNIM